MNIRLIMAAIALPCLLATGGNALAQPQTVNPDMEILFANLVAEERKPRDTLVELVEAGSELEAVAAFTVANADSIGIAVVYAHEAVCLAPDQLAAEVVAKRAIDSASEAARNAVEARVTDTLINFNNGACDVLIDERNNASQAFAASAPGTGDGSTAGGGATPPEVDNGDDDVSPSQ